MCPVCVFVISSVSVPYTTLFFNSHSFFALLSTCVSPILITFTEKSFYLSFESVYLRSAVSTMFGRFDRVSPPTKCTVCVG